MLIEKIISLIKDNGLLEKHHLDSIGIFGSILYSESPNDIDILISSFDNFEDLVGFQEDLELLSGLKVDVVVEKYASPIIVYRAKKDLRHVA